MIEGEIVLEIIIVVSAFGLTAWLIWYSRRLERELLAEQGSESRVQDVDVAVESGFRPAFIVVKAGRPVRLNFTRREASPCGDEVVIPAFIRRVHLPLNRTVTVELTPEKPGRYEFTCDKQVCRGKLVVE